MGEDPQRICPKQRFCYAIFIIYWTIPAANPEKLRIQYGKWFCMRKLHWMPNFWSGVRILAGCLYWIEATDKNITWGAMEFFRLKDGIITEIWESWPLHDMTDLLTSE